MNDKITKCTSNRHCIDCLENGICGYIPIYDRVFACIYKFIIIFECEIREYLWLFEFSKSFYPEPMHSFCGIQIKYYNELHIVGKSNQNSIECDTMDGKSDGDDDGAKRNQIWLLTDYKKNVYYFIIIISFNLLENILNEKKGSATTLDVRNGKVKLFSLCQRFFFTSSSKTFFFSRFMLIRYCTLVAI